MISKSTFFSRFIEEPFLICFRRSQNYFNFLVVFHLSWENIIDRSIKGFGNSFFLVTVGIFKPPLDQIDKLSRNLAEELKIVARQVFFNPNLAKSISFSD